MNRLFLLSLFIISSFPSFAQNNKDQSGPNDHLIKKNLLVDGNISSAGGKDLILQTNQITRFTVLDANGYVGIDITNPQERLHINGSVRGNSQGGALRVNTEHGWLDLGPQDGQSVHLHTNMSKFVLNKDLHVDGAIGSFGSQNLELQTGGNTHITVLDNNGFVGIGVSTPSERLEVVGNAKVSETITGKDLVSETITTTEGNFQGNVNMEQNLNVFGLVGLGVANPTEKLEVEGNVKVSDQITTNSLMAESGNFTQDVAIGGNTQVDQNVIIGGNLGIGITSPVEKVEVAGNMKITNKISAAELEAGKGEFSDRLTVANDLTLGGNLGIGVQQPTEKLEIAGNAVISETLTANTINASALAVNEDLSVTGNTTTEQNAYIGGQLGIGVADPSEKLDVVGNIKASDKVISTGIEATNGTFAEGVSVGNILTVAGQIAIGTMDPKEYKLAVAGEIAVEEITVEVEANWPDYVFDENYNLRPLAEINAYVKKHHHLPEVPSAKEITDNGMKVGEMNLILLKKIEELTLHLIEKDLQLQQVMERLSKLENK